MPGLLLWFDCRAERTAEQMSVAVMEINSIRRVAELYSR